MTDAALKSKVDEILDNLPPNGQVELAQFLDFLADKYQVEQDPILFDGISWRSH